MVSPSGLPPKARNIFASPEPPERETPLSNQTSSAKTDEPLTKIIEIAARLTDLEFGTARYTTKWLRGFRRNYRHMAVTFGIPFNYVSLSDADAQTDKALDDKSEAQAA